MSIVHILPSNTLQFHIEENKLTFTPDISYSHITLYHIIYLVISLKTFLGLLYRNHPLLLTDTKSLFSNMKLFNIDIFCAIKHLQKASSGPRKHPTATQEVMHFKHSEETTVFGLGSI